MTNILYLSASIRDGDSVSRELGDKLVESLAAKDGASVTRRDLSSNDLPYLTHERHMANLTPASERTPEQGELASIADELINELQAADTIVLSVPIYNFSVPATVKSWADLVARAGTTFKYTENGPEGLLTGKTAYITVASGGVPVGSDADMMTKWLKFFLGFLGIETKQVIAADGIMGVNADEKIANAKAEIEKLAA